MLIFLEIEEQPQTKNSTNDYQTKLWERLTDQRGRGKWEELLNNMQLKYKTAGIHGKSKKRRGLIKKWKRNDHKMLNFMASPQRSIYTYLFI